MLHLLKTSGRDVHENKWQGRGPFSGAFLDGAFSDNIRNGSYGKMTANAG